MCPPTNPYNFWKKCMDLGSSFLALRDFETFWIAIYLQPINNWYIYIDYEGRQVGKISTFSSILDEVLAVNNKRNQLKSKGIKVYRSKQSMTSSWSIKPKYINDG